MKTKQTQAQFRAMIIAALRQASRWWPAKNEVIRRAKRGFNRYECEMCKTIWPSSLPALTWNKRKRKNIIWDHIFPIVDPKEGFKSYDLWIERCFVDESGFQAICWSCHQIKTKEENAERKKFKN